jgi:hypothetical protein
MIEKLLANICNTRSCQERDYLVWNQRPYSAIHVRVDGGFIKSTRVKKNDCLLLCAPSRNFTFVVFVEVKKESYTLDEVVEQLQNGRDAFNQAMAEVSRTHENADMIVPMLPPHLQTRKAATHVAESLSNIRRNRFKIIPVLCAKKKKKRILEKSGLHKRVALSPRFKIRVGKNYEPIRFVESGVSLWDSIMPTEPERL